MRVLLLALFGVLLALPSFGAQPEDLGISVRDTVQATKEKPAILLAPTVGVKSLIVTLKNMDSGATQTLRARNLSRGKKKALAFDQRVGSADYEAHFAVVWKAGGKAEFAFTFSAHVVGPMKLSVSQADVDLDARWVRFSSTRVTQMAEVNVYGEGKRLVGQGRVEFNGASPGGKHRVTWKQNPANVRLLELKVTDPQGFWKAMEIRPFFVEPRTDNIFFATGAYQVEASQRDKLNATMQWVREGVREAKKQAGVALSMRLYVGGYTDTVGSPDSNRTLSMNRAKSIARYFRAQGLSLSIYYQGFGEDALAVKTPDNTASEKNRRTVYVLTSQKPPRSALFPKGDWRLLK